MPLWLSDELSVCANTGTQHDSRLGANFTLSAGAAAAAARRICSAPRSLCLTWSVIFTFDHNLLMFMPHKGGIGRQSFLPKKKEKNDTPITLSLPAYSKCREACLQVCNYAKREPRSLNIPHQTCGSSLISSRWDHPWREAFHVLAGGLGCMTIFFFFFPICTPLISNARRSRWIRCRTFLVAEQPGRRGTGERRANPGWHAITRSVARWQCWRKWSGADLCAFACVCVLSMLHSLCSTIHHKRNTSFSTLRKKNCGFKIVSFTICWLEPSWPRKVCVTNQSVNPDSSGVFLREVAGQEAKSHSPVLS